MKIWINKREMPVPIVPKIQSSFEMVKRFSLFIPITPLKGVWPKQKSIKHK